MKKFRIKKTTSERWSVPLDLEPVLTKWGVLAEKLGGPFRLRELQTEGAEWSAPANKNTTQKTLKGILSTGKVGEVWATDTAREPHIVVRIVDVKPEIPDSPGTSAIDKVRWYLFTNFNLESWGLCVCKKIAGSTSYSQHAYCNAEDYHGTATEMSSASLWLARNAAKDIQNFPAAEIIYNRKIWTPPEAWHYYGGINPHTDHIHVSGFPLQSGSNPSAC